MHARCRSWLKCYLPHNKHNWLGINSGHEPVDTSEVMELESSAEEPPETRGVGLLPTDVKTGRQQPSHQNKECFCKTSDRLKLYIALVRSKNTWLASGKKSSLGLKSPVLVTWTQLESLLPVKKYCFFQHHRKLSLTRVKNTLFCSYKYSWRLPDFLSRICDIMLKNVQTLDPSSKPSSDFTFTNAETCKANVMWHVQM